MTDKREISPDWDNDKWGEEDWTDFLGCDVEQLEETMENQMD